MVHAALPLRSADARLDIDRLALDLAGAPGIERGVVLVIPPSEVADSVVYVHLERAADHVRVAGSMAGRDPGRWCVVRQGDLGAVPAGALVRGGWVALAPETE